MAEEPVSSARSDDKDYQRYKSFFSDAVINCDAPVNFDPGKSQVVKNPYQDSDLKDDWTMADPAVAAAEPAHLQPYRTMFVTIGSIASFKDLVEEVVSDKFLETLAELKFNRLIVQCGPDLELFERLRPQKGFDSHWIDISGFAYTDDMKSHLLKCAPSNGGLFSEKRGRGIIMAHAGAGTILEALTVDARVIVVPNTSLMDNHQLELAEELDKQGYLIQGHLGQLHADVEKMEKFEPVNWPPKRPKDSRFGHVGDIINWMLPAKDITEAPEEEVRQMPLEEQMWYDMYANQPFPDGDPRHEFLNGLITKKKTEMFGEWRANWYAKRKIADRLSKEKQKGEEEQEQEEVVDEEAKNPRH